MDYNVIAPDGAVYGPVDETTLKQWVSEARVLPTTMIEEVGRGRRFEAKTMSSLFPTEMLEPAAATKSVLHSGYEEPKTTTTSARHLATDPTAVSSAFQRVSPNPGYASATSRAPIDSHLVKAVIALLLCIPIGAFAVYFALQVDGKIKAGDRLSAQENADKANLFANVALWIVGIGTFLIIAAVVALYFIGAHALANAHPTPTQ